jgi:hypothetical protein
MKGDIAFAGFMMTADEWQELDAGSRAQLIAVATRRADPFLDPPRRFPEGTGKHEVIPMLEADDVLETDELLELELEEESNLEPVSSTVPTVDEGWEDFSDLNEI